MGEASTSTAIAQSSRQVATTTETTTLQQMSPMLCKQGILYRFEELANQLSVGWKYHVANDASIKDSWTKFEDFYQSICSFTEGLQGLLGKLNGVRSVRIDGMD